nr:DGQHR domain-containing protein [Moraxella sp. CTOTU47616]
MNFEVNEYPFLKVNFSDIPTYTINMKVKDILRIYYVAVRGIDGEEGAVQRVLNPRRINLIKEYILEGNTFFNSFILNWNSKDFPIKVSSEKLFLTIAPNSAQVIDGQHRLEGLKHAFEKNESIGEQSILVTICENLNTSQAAKIFLNINTEQKPVPKSLIYDLFGEVINDEEHSIIRATDIAKALNENPNSPLYQKIKFPGSPKKGSIDLSTFVTSIKSSLQKDGVFAQYNIRNLDDQIKVVENFFSSIKNSYNSSSHRIWDTSKNPFLKASGFNGGMDYLLETLIRLCAEEKSFKVETMTEILNLDENDLLMSEDVKGMDGKSSKRKIKDYLGQYYLKRVSQNAYQF